MAGIRHQFVSATPDGPDTGDVRPSDWNAEHVLAEDSAAPPAADSTNKGTYYLRRAGSGQPSQLLLSVQTSTDGVYEWLIVAQSS